MPMPKPKIENRYFPTFDLKIEKRKDGNEKIVGYSAVFNKESLNLGWFVEKIQPGAFENALKKSDARALFNHNVDYVLGRQSSKTLFLEEREEGLYEEIDYPKTQLIKDLVIEPIRRKDITEQSFGFTVKTDSWKRSKDKNAPDLRIIIEIDELFDVSPVTFAAYPDTSVALRSFNTFINKDIVENKDINKDEINFDELRNIYEAIITGKSIKNEDIELFRDRLTIILKKIESPEPMLDGDSKNTEPMLKVVEDIDLALKKFRAGQNIFS